jgi:hypothetical protein
MELVKKPKEEKEEIKSKSVIIDGALHARMKNYCTGTKRKIGGVIEDLIKLYLSNPKELQKQIDNLNGN